MHADNSNDWHDGGGAGRTGRKPDTRVRLPSSSPCPRMHVPCILGMPGMPTALTVGATRRVAREGILEGEPPGEPSTVAGPARQEPRPPIQPSNCVEQPVVPKGGEAGAAGLRTRGRRRVRQRSESDEGRARVRGSRPRRPAPPRASRCCHLRLSAFICVHLWLIRCRCGCCHPCSSVSICGNNGCCPRVPASPRRF